ncbi:MAG: pyridoxal phosphate-dependent decarboxylase family protein [Halobacteriota archaeon]
MTDATAPGDLEPAVFRELGYRTIDIMTEHYANVTNVETLPDRSPQAVAALFDEPLPETGVDPDDLLADWVERIYPNAAHNGSPRWFGYVKGSGTQVGALADALAASVNMNAWGQIGGPSAAEVERQTIEWLSELIGYHDDAGGVLTSGGSMANHTAIYAALQRASDFEAGERGLRALDGSGRFTLYTSAHEHHSSVERVASMIGIGTDAIRYVPCDESYRLDPEALEAMVIDDEEAGHTPFCAIAQVGSINVGAIDPLEAMADVCERHDLWFHADGACGAVGACLPELEDDFAGLERADSVTLDPHKWLSVPYACGCVLFRDATVQARTYAMDAEYLDRMADDAYHGMDYSSMGPELSRPFRALKVWMSLKHRGLEGYRDQFRRSLRCAEHLHELVREADDFEVLHEPTLFIYSFRYVPADLGRSERTKEPVEAYLDWVNQRITDEVRRTGEAFVTTTGVDERTVLRLSICSHRTTIDDIDRTFELLRHHGERIDREERSAWLDRD